MDYERHPTQEEHPFVAVAMLREQGWPESVLQAILAHADYSGVVPDTHLDRALFACDELAGFLTACALVKPTKSILDVEVKGVLKKMKDKAFARAVKREDMTAGAALLGLSIEEHVGNCVAAMQARATELGLAGGAPGELTSQQFGGINPLDASFVEGEVGGVDAAGKSDRAGGVFEDNGIRSRAQSHRWRNGERRSRRRGRRGRGVSGRARGGSRRDPSA